MNLFEIGGGMPTLPRTPNIAEVPTFGFGLSTITDLFGLTEPQVSTTEEALSTPQANRGQQQNDHTRSAFQPFNKQEQRKVNTVCFENEQMHENLYPTSNPEKSFYSPAASLSTFSQVTTATSHCHDYLQPPSSLSFEVPIVPNYNVHVDPNTDVTFCNVPTANYQYQRHQQQPNQVTLELNDHSSVFAPISTASSNSTFINTTSKIQNPPLSNANPLPTLLLPVTSTSSNEVLIDLTRRSASPLSSGVQIDLINLRQKLNREIQNHMKTTTEQQKRVQDLQNRADIVEKDYAHLKCDLEDLKRKDREQKGKLNEIDSLIKSTLTMSSFSSPSSLRVEMIEGENENDTTVVVLSSELYE